VRHFPEGEYCSDDCPDLRLDSLLPLVGRMDGKLRLLLTVYQKY
jgi:hypothetical protein